MDNFSYFLYLILWVNCMFTAFACFYIEKIYQFFSYWILGDIFILMTCKLQILSPVPCFLTISMVLFDIYNFLKSDLLDFDRESKCVIVLCHSLKGISEFKIINHQVDSSCNFIVSLPYLNYVFILNLSVWIYTIEYFSTHQWPHDWKRSVFIPIPKKGNAKECSNYRTIVLISHVSKIILKILQARLQQYVNRELPDVHTWFQRSRGIRDQIDNICGSWRKQGSSRKASASTSLTTLKPLTVWITTNSAKFLKRWEY